MCYLRFGDFQAIHSVAWHHEGKQFLCSHSDGTLTTWNIRTPAKPTQIITPHGRERTHAITLHKYTRMPNADLIPTPFDNRKAAQGWQEARAMQANTEGGVQNHAGWVSATNRPILSYPQADFNILSRKKPFLLFCHNSSCVSTGVLIVLGFSL